jgi:urea carboxylase
LIPGDHDGFLRTYGSAHRSLSVVIQVVDQGLALVQVLQGGMMTSVQDWPGRTKLWHVGVPPSGPMDATALRYANALVGNEPSAAGLEITLRGPELLFHRPAAIAVCGGAFPVTVAGVPVDMWAVVQVQAGDKLQVGSATGGARCYLAVDGGFDAPLYLGSRSTFPGGSLGGYQGRVLQVSPDRLQLRSCCCADMAQIGR